MWSSHSSTPKILSVCAFHWVMARKEPVDVTTTLPDASPEYILSLSSDTESALIGEECERSICCGVGGGGAADILLPNMTKGVVDNFERRVLLFFQQHA